MCQLNMPYAVLISKHKLETQILTLFFNLININMEMQ